MKTKIFLLFSTIIFILSCKDNNMLTFDTYDFSSEKCASCPEVSISFPKYTEATKISETINNALQEEIISQLNYEDEIETTTIEKASKTFKDKFLELSQKFPDETVVWEATIDGEAIHEDKNTITIELSAYIFTGGAHGYTSTTYLNFDKKKGTELENWELFKDKDLFSNFLETKFRIQESIPQDKSINSTGFMFENDKFHLPENIGFTKKGLQFIYNPYEVASYVDGPVTITIPYNQVNTYLTIKTKN